MSKTHPWDEPCGAMAQRKIVMSEIERLRADKTIGKSEDARIICNFTGQDWFPEMQPREFAEFCKVSQCRYEFGGAEGFTVRVEKSPLKSCQRCSRRVPSVETYQVELCHRCRDCLNKAYVGDYPLDEPHTMGGQD